MCWCGKCGTWRHSWSTRQDQQNVEHVIWCWRCLECIRQCSGCMWECLECDLVCDCVRRKCCTWMRCWQSRPAKHRTRSIKCWTRSSSIMLLLLGYHSPLDVYVTACKVGGCGVQTTSQRWDHSMGWPNALPWQTLKVHGHGQTHSRNFCRFKLDI